MKKNNHALITWGIIGLICLLGTGAVWGQYTPRAYYTSWARTVIQSYSWPTPR
jgi:hypothetical protein